MRLNRSGEQECSSIILLIIALVTALVLLAAAAGFAWRAQRSARRQRAAAARLQRLVAATSDMIAIVGAEGYRSASPAALTVTGYRPDELQHVPLGALVHPDDAPAAKGVIAGVKAGVGDGRWEGRLVRKDGSTVWVETALSYDPSEQVVHLISRNITARKQAEVALQESERRLRSLVDHHPDAVAVLDREGTLVDFNPLLATASGYPAEQLRGGSWRLLLDLADAAAAEVVLAQTLAGVPSECELGVMHRAGHRVEASITVIPIMRNAEVEGFYAIAKDITDRKRADAALRESETRYRTLTEAVSDAIFTTALDGAILFVNPAAEALFGYGAADLAGAALHTLLPPEVVRGVLERDASYISAARALTLTGVHRSGRKIPLEVTFSETRLDGQPIFIWFARDISARKEAEARLSYLADHDQLTGLPNQAYLVGRLTELGRRPAGTCALLVLDLDRFRLVNDSLGQPAGDELLIAVAERLRATVGSGAAVVRLGGDNFAVLLPNAAGVAGATAVAEQVCEGMNRPFVVRGRELVVTASIGIVLAEGALGPDEVVRHAGIALHTAKVNGKNRYALFDPGMSDTELQRLELEADLRRAVERQEFTLVYQPMVLLESGAVVGVEALVRWTRPGHGNVPPLSFIGVAEESGLILPLGRWILAESCRQVRQWQQQFGRRLELSVNLSARQLLQPDLTGEIAAILAETGLDPSTLVLEITESILVPQDPVVLETLAELRARGIRVAMDDFGTGYSALSYIQRLPVDVLKVDRSFVAGLGTGKTDSAIVQALVSFAGAVNLSTVGEGVETEEQRELLRALGCRYAQGYLFARPLPPGQMASYLHNANESMTP